MGTHRTYYDVLHLAPGAPDAVIRAAYRALSQAAHPDKRGGDPQASDDMAAINEAYSVLGRPARRRRYDEWLRAQSGAEEGSTQNRAAYAPEAGAACTGAAWRSHDQSVRWGRFVALLAAVLGVVLLMTRPSGSALAKDPPGTLEADPKGRPWPTEAGYLRGFAVRARGGASQIVVDNTGSDGAVYAKLMGFGGEGVKSLRHFFVPAGERFVLEEVPEGNYEVRYMDLGSGTRARTDAFIIQGATLSGLPGRNVVTVTLIEADGLDRLEASPLAVKDF